MPTATYAGHPIQVNVEGFFLDRAQWTPEIAAAVASEVGITPLTAEHWKVLTFCRDDTDAQGHSPGLRRIAAVGGVSIKDLYRLFPKGPGKLAARIAGLPKPTACI